MFRSLRLVALATLLLTARFASAQTETIGFEDLSIPADPQITGNNTGASGGELFSETSLTDGGAVFNSTYDPNEDYWTGWAFSNAAGVTVPTNSQYQSNLQDDYANPYQFSSYTAAPGSNTGGGAGGSANYALGYYDGYPSDCTIALPSGANPVSIGVTNTTYAALSMLYGDGFSFAFTPGQDFLKLEIIGTNASNNTVGEVDFYLANYLSANSAQDYIVNQWTNVSLSSLAGATTLSFVVVGSQNNPDFAPETILTPPFFAVDNLVVSTPEPSSLVLVLVAGACAASAMIRRRIGSQAGRRFTAEYGRVLAGGGWRGNNNAC